MTVDAGDQKVHIFRFDLYAMHTMRSYRLYYQTMTSLGAIKDCLLLAGTRPKFIGGS